jgi:putative ABC transport system permease protein
MIPMRMMPLVMKQLTRRRVRTGLTLAGIAMAMFLFAAIQSLHAGVREATRVSSNETNLVVFRQNRYCAFTSRLPQGYEARIGRIPGVAEVLPVQITVSNCRTALDVVTFRGVPPERARETFSRQFRVVEGSLDQWLKRSDAALVGKTLADRRRLKVGDSFDAASVRVTVAGIIESTREQDRNVAYVHLPFLQQSSGLQKLGVVTQFSVRVTDPALLDTVAQAIDAEFADEPDPTTTSSEQAFVARAAQDIVRLVDFTRFLGWGCLIAVLALVANAMILSQQDRVREHAVFQTLGYSGGLIARLLLGEALLVGLLGGGLGGLLAHALLTWRTFSLTSEGLSINVMAHPGTLVAGLLLSAVLGTLAGLIPAWQASRKAIVECFRAV